MGFSLSATCVCGYESERLAIGDGTSRIAKCPACKEIVNPKQARFRLLKPPCNRCHTKINSDDFVASQFIVFDQASRIRCPRCEERNIVFHEHMYFMIAPDFAFPSVGELVDGYLIRDGGSMIIADVSLGSLENIDVIHDAPANTPGRKPFTMKVIAVHTKTRPRELVSRPLERDVTGIELRFVGFLEE